MAGARRTAVQMGWLALAGALAACSSEPRQDKPVAAEPATADTPAAVAPPESGPTASDASPQVPTLSAEDERLIAADPKTLTPDERRKRSFALRRKIMQNPDSPAALMLEDLRKAHGSGELEVPKPGEGPRFETRGGATPGSAPPAGVRRPPAGAPPAEPTASAPVSGAP